MSSPRVDLEPVRDRLIAAATARQLVHESELESLLQIDLGSPYFRGQVLSRVSELSKSEVLRGRPMLTAILVDPDSMLPGKAFYRMGRHLGLFQDGEDEPAFAVRQIRRVHDYWEVARG